MSTGESSSGAVVISSIHHDGEGYKLLQVAAAATRASQIYLVNGKLFLITHKHCAKLAKI